MTIKVLLFDYDDVLTTYPSFSPISKELSPYINQPSKKILAAFLKHEPKYLVGKITNKQFWDLFAQELGIEPEYELFNQKFLTKSKVNKQLLRILELFKHKYHLGIITDNYYETKRIIHHQMDYLFENIIFSCDNGFTKKDIQPFKLALENFRAEPDECIFIDNNKKNLHQAKKLGMHTIHYVADNGHSLKKLLKQLQELGVE